MIQIGTALGDNRVKDMTFSCFIIGEGTLSIQCAEILLEHGHAIHGIISANPAIQQWAQQQAIESIAPHADNLLEILRGQPFDYLFSIANLSIISSEVLALPRKSAINFHDGPLPKYAGLHATTWAIMNQERTHGITWHEMGDKVDTGDILKQEFFDIAEDETTFTLNAKCYDAAIRSFAEMITALASGNAEPVKQSLEERTFFSKYERPPAKAIIEWNQPADKIAAFVRALDFGPYANPLTIPKVLVGDELFLVPQIEVTEARSTAAPGTVTAITGDALTVATATNEVVIPSILALDGPPVILANHHMLKAGFQFQTLDAKTAEQLTLLNRTIIRSEEFWLNRLASLAPIEPPYDNRRFDDGTPGSFATISMSLPDEVTSIIDQYAEPADFLVAAFGGYLALASGSSAFDVGFSDATLQRELAGFESFFASRIPFHVEINPLGSVQENLQALFEQLALIRKRKTYARSVMARYPELRDRGGQPVFPVVVEQRDGFDDYSPASNSELTVVFSTDGKTCRWVYQSSVFDSDSIKRMQRQFSDCLRNMVANLHQPMAEISLLAEEEQHRILVEWNATQKDYPTNACIHQLFEAQAARTPDAVAVVCGDEQLTYQELNTAANQLAHYLRKLGARPDMPIGIFMDRSLELMVGLFGILKAGGAYVPLDPTYPAERIAFMVEDSEVPILVTKQRFVNHLPPHQAAVVCVDSAWNEIAQEQTENFDSGVTPDHLSYMIYTSGSTGKPKGVMVQHGNVVNFFAGMDDCIPHKPAGTWLAVTSLSFDISGLELFWTLARGFKVVLYAGSDRSPASADSASQETIDFSLFYFASDEGENVADKYDLLLEGAKYADRNGFSAIWTPERHFGAFGGLYPNPSVTSAAIAAVTKSVNIRAGSCVSPLHSPIRIAEEWALVDNISKGRVGISFASGWQPNDFVLKPENFANRKNIMFENIDTVHRLWRGESVLFPGPNGKEVEIRTLPRPVQPELPTWVTIAGNPETFQMAGAGGYNLLTHLLGQSIEQLAEKIEIYRKARQEHGHEGEGYVTLMLHTFVGDDDAEVREIVRKPMKDYLAGALDLTEQAAWSFPTFKERATATGKSLREMFAGKDLTPEEKDAILNFAFERYFETSGLFGTVETCLKMVNRLKEIGVDEIACLIDFGVNSPAVLKHLEHLNHLRELSNEQPTVTHHNDSIPALMTGHKVTHFQCTPSMASMLTADDEARSALRGLRALMIGGEAFPAALASELSQLVLGKIINMYGPTETTIWSSTHALNGSERSVPIGRPIANTSLYILDNRLHPVPVGMAGELFIGGHGVVRGYWHRPELTAERFIPDPFSGTPYARLYRTGDLARYLPNGDIEFLGRNDYQVKIRGYRIELGEIEKLLDQHPAVSKSVVIARQDIPGDTRLAAYLVVSDKSSHLAKELREYLKGKLPEFMVPAYFVVLKEFPLTPNLKIDRKALPAPDVVETDGDYVEPENTLEQQIAGIWQELLGVNQIGVHDDFFDLGGHSILAVHAHRRICEVVNRQLAISDLFRFTTVRKLADFLRS